MGVVESCNSGNVVFFLSDAGCAVTNLGRRWGEVLEQRLGMSNQRSGLPLRIQIKT